MEQRRVAEVSLSTARRRRALAAFAVLVLSTSHSCASQPAEGEADVSSASAIPAGGDLELAFAVDRAGLPPLPYGAITLKVDALGAVAAAVQADGVEIPSRLVRGKVVFTTDAHDIVVTLRSPTEAGRAGGFERAALKDDKAWAWSHGFDDNTMLQPGIDAFRARGWRAMLYMICESIDDARREEHWILDAPGLKRLLGEGWGVGNHSWDHGAADDVGAARESVVRCSERLARIVADSPRPEYKVIAFAAPAFDARYADIIRALRDRGVTDLLYDESGGDAVIRVDPGATDAPVGAALFDTDLVIGRYTPIGWDAAAAIAAMDAVSEMADESTHLWFNSLAHGSNEDALVPVLEHVYTHYGPGGTEEVLVAPSDEIYSYLLVRDRAKVEFRGSRAR